MNIDSDKLLEWFKDYTRWAATNEDISDNERECLEVAVDDLEKAIQSGELAPKRVYARAPDSCRGYLTAGKEYEVENDDGRCFDIIDDEGEKIRRVWHADAHIYGANWERVEK